MKVPMLLIQSLILFLFSSTSECANADREEHDQRIFWENFHCTNPGEYPPHRPNAPNCPCGTYAEKVKNKHLRKYEARNGYWDTDKKRWQVYRCRKCDICYRVPVERVCSTYNNTVCGETCYPPFQQTNIGCFEPSTNASFKEPTEVLLSAGPTSPSSTTSDVPVYLCNKPCTMDNDNDYDGWMTFIHVVILIILWLFVIAALVLCCMCTRRYCKSTRRQRIPQTL